MREPPQPPQPSLEQRSRTLHIAAPVMVKRRGYLNDSLQKCFIRFWRSQPNLFPSLVRIEKSPAVKLLQPGHKPLAMFASGVFGGRTCIARLHSERFRHPSGASLRLRLRSVPQEAGGSLLRARPYPRCLCSCSCGRLGIKQSFRARVRALLRARSITRASLLFLLSPWH
jgi:hypothetical protein